MLSGNADLASEHAFGKRAPGFILQQLRNTANSFTKQVTPVLAERIIGRRVSTQRKTALARCCCEPAERKNQPSFVMSASRFAPVSTNCLVSSPIVSSKQISGASWTSPLVSQKTV